jgi:RNA polymerase sigma-54 factor
MAPEIRLDTGLHARLEQRLKLAPQIIQSIEILQLPALALEEFVLREMSENPVIEMKSAAPGDEERDAGEGEIEDEEDPVQREIAAELREFSGERPQRPDPDASDRKQQAMLNTAARPVSLQEYLSAQFRLLDLPKAVSAVGEEIVTNLDDNGYLRTSLEELVDGSEGGYDLEDAEAALAQVQGLEPPGVGGRSLQECLLLQVGADGHDLVRWIISDFLGDVERNRLPKIARRTTAEIEQIKDAVEYISHLNPRPGSLFSGQPAPRILPDLMVEYTDTGYEVRLEDGHIPNLAISMLYEKLAASDKADPAARKYLKDKIRAARWLIDAIEQRKTTLYRITRAIVDMQKEFFDYGLSHLKPLRMQEIADKVGVHVSTVSRAIADKYVQTPRGIFPLKYFFTGGLITGEGELQTWRTVQQEIKDLVDGEDRSKPLSDEEISKQLAEKGYEVARRTVTKYRKSLGIPSSRRRKSY